jgi:pimeloyl-ACP methyl ester carboxylesterase
VLVPVALLATACPAPDLDEMVESNPWALARENGRYVEVKGLRIYALTLGSGPDVVLIHGNPDSMRTWKYVVEPLAEHYRVHAIDLPGFGMSDKPDVAYEDAWLAEHVVGYLDAAGAASAALVGNSMGGTIATETAMLFPARVRALVLLGTSGLPPPTGVRPAVEEGDTFVVQLLRWPGMEAVVRAFPTKGVLREQVAPAYFDPEKLSEAELEQWHRPLRTAGGMKAFLARSAQQPDPARAERVRSIVAPTLLIHGDTDRLVPVEVAHRHDALIPESELLIFEETGHIPQEDQPERVVREIRRWLEMHR